MIDNLSDALIEIDEIGKLTDNNEAVERIKNLVERLDISASGTKTVLYSGMGETNIKKPNSLHL